MKRKKISPEEQVKTYAQFIKQEISDWQTIAREGCSDPTWADGTNMNLIRNHILYAREHLSNICSENSIALPDSYYLPVPPYVDENYFAKPKSDRAIRIMSRPGWKCHNHCKPCSPKLYNPDQLSLN